MPLIFSCIYNAPSGHKRKIRSTYSPEVSGRPPPYKVLLFRLLLVPRYWVAKDACRSWVQTLKCKKRVVSLKSSCFINSNIHHENMPNNFDPIKPHFYIVKLGFAGVDINFLITAQNIDYRYPLEPPQRGGSNE